MRTIRLLIIELIAFLFLFSCATKNMFYGIDAEDIEGPSISVDYPSTSQTLSGTFTLIGRSQDKGGNEVLKVEVSVNSGTTWRLASGTTNWSITIDSILEWGTSSGVETILIRSSDTNYKKNTTQISRAYNYDNTNPGITGSIDDSNDVNPPFYHRVGEGNVRYFWLAVPGAVDYQASLYVNGVLAGVLTQSDANVALVGVYNVAYDFTVGGGTKDFEFTGIHGNYYSITVIARDGAANPIGAPQVGKRITVDLVAPAIGAGVNFRVNGQASGAVIATDPTFTWVTGQLSDSYSGVDYVNLNVTGQPTVTLSGNTIGNYTLSLGNGVYTATLTVFDKAGNNTTSAGLNFTVNKTAPSGAISITRTAGFNLYRNTATFSFEWDHSALSNVAGYDIQVVRDDSQVDTYLNVPAGGAGPLAAVNSDTFHLTPVGNITTASFNGINFPNGKIYKIQVMPYNSAGFRGSTWYSSPTIGIDTNAPNAITNLRAGGTATGYTQNTNITLTWDAANDVGISGVFRYRINRNGTDLFTAGPLSSYALAGLNLNASNTVTVFTVDNAGNESAGVPITVLSDNQPPNAPLNFQFAGSIVTPRHFNTAQMGVNLAWTAASDPPTSSGISYYEISTDGGATVAKTNIAVTSTAMDFLVKSTSYTLQVRAVDYSGNPSAWSASIVLHVDNQKPNVPTNLQYGGSPLSPRYFNTDQLGAALSWTAPVDNGSSGIAYYQVTLDGTNPNGADIIHPTALTTRDFILPSTTYYLKVRAVDNAGNIGDWSTAITIHVENTPPADVTTVIGTYLAPNAVFAWPAATDAGSGVQEYEIQSRINGGAWSASTLQPSTAFTYDMSALVSTDTVEIQIRGIDHSGNPSAGWTLSNTVIKP